MPMYAAIIVLTALLLGSRSSIVAGLLSLAVAFGLLWAEKSGMLMPISGDEEVVGYMVGHGLGC